MNGPGRRPSEIGKPDFELLVVQVGDSRLGWRAYGAHLRVTEKFHSRSAGTAMVFSTSATWRAASRIFGTISSTLSATR
jgi:hypothetical protein